MDIGFTGIGQMGRRMTARILATGYGLIVNDLKKEAAGKQAVKVGGDTPTPEKAAGFELHSTHRE